MRAVNLLPRDDGRQAASKDAALPLIVGASGAIFVVAILGSLTMIEKGKLTRAKSDLASVEQQLSALPQPPPEPTQEEKQLATQQTARIAALSTALARRVAWDRVLREVSLTLPDDISLQSLEAKSPVTGSTQNPAAPTSAASLAQGLTIHGTTYSHASVARLLSRLQVIPDLTNVQLIDSTAVGVPGGPRIVSFQIAADVRLPGSSS
jgi:Tfp pilus assembly protein PilN